MREVWLCLYLYEFMKAECRTVEDILDWYEVADEEIKRKERP